MNYLKFSILLSLSLASTSLSAHVRWFVEEPIHAGISFNWSPIYILIALCATVYCTACYALNKPEARLAMRNPHLFTSWGNSGQLRLISGAVGLCLLINGFNEVFLAPNLPALVNLSPNSVIQLVTGLIMVSGQLLRASAISLIAMISFCGVTLPFNLWIDYGPEFLGFGLALLYYKQPSVSLSWLRISFGGQLIILALHNKLTNPSLGLEFLQQQQWNFMQALGFESFGDLEFIFSAGMAELALGVTMILGWSTRLTTAITAHFFILSSLILGPHELIGHLPIIAAAIALITLGGGRKLPWKQSVKDTTQFPKDTLISR